MKVPQPSISVTLFFFIRKCTPLAIRSATVRLRLKATPKSNVTSPLMPKCLRLVGEEVGDLGVAQQGLGRDAADVVADPAPVLQLDDRGLQAQLGGADGGHVAAGTGTQHDDVIVVRSWAQP